MLAERKQALDAATAAAERQQRELAAREAAMSAAATKLEQQQAAAIAASDEIERQRKAIEAARRGLAGVEAALDAREAQLAESWGQLAANAAALKAGDLDGLSLRASVSSCSAADSGFDRTGQRRSVGLYGSSPARLFAPPHLYAVCSTAGLCRTLWYPWSRRQQQQQPGALQPAAQQHLRPPAGPQPAP